MKSSQIISVFKGPVGYVLVIGVAALALYYFKDAIFGHKQKDAPGNGYVGGITGAIGGTSDLQTSTNLDGSAQTAYEGKGAIGSLGGVFNNASGGVLSSAGESIGGWIYDVTHPGQ